MSEKNKINFLKPISDLVRVLSFGRKAMALEHKVSHQLLGDLPSLSWTGSAHRWGFLMAALLITWLSDSFCTF